MDKMKKMFGFKSDHSVEGEEEVPGNEGATGGGGLRFADAPPSPPGKKKTVRVEFPLESGGSKTKPTKGNKPKDKTLGPHHAVS